MEDGDAGSEFGSIISLQSLEDGSQYHLEKPKYGKKSRGHSPYLSQSSGGLSAKAGPRRTGHEAWSAAIIKNGFTGLSSENSTSNWMTSPQRKSKTGRTSNGPFSRDEHVLASGKPAYKSPEDYYDEVMELRQVIKSLKADNGVLKTKLQRSTQENVLKDRQIKDFLNPNKQPDDIRRTLTDRNADSSAVVSSLKQKLHLMERNAKDKENELRKLKSDLKATNSDELRIQMETYYEETQRLQAVLSSVYSQGPGTRNIPDTRLYLSQSSSRMDSPGRGGLGRTDADQLETILDENRRLESENQSLKKDLLCAIDGQRRPNKEKISKEKNVDYADMNRLQMLRKIGELEQLLEDAKTKPKSDAKESRKHSPGEENETELRKQRVIIENLKQDRKHYREEAEKLRTKLEAAEDEITVLKEKLRKTNEKSSRDLEKEEQTLRPTPRQRNRTGSLKKKISFREDIVKDDRQKDLLSHKEDQAARVLQRNWRKYNNQDHRDKDRALAVLEIQSALRAHAVRRRRIQSFSDAKDDVEDELEWEDAVTRVQSAMRAHNARRKYYSNVEKFTNVHSNSELSDDSDMKEKQEKRKNFKQQSFLKKSQSSRPSSETRNLSNLGISNKDDTDDSDDGVVIGGSRQNLRANGKTSSISRDEAPVRKQKSLTAVNDRRSRDEVNSDHSEDDIQTSTRFGKPISKSKKITSPNENDSSFHNSTRKKEIDEQKLRSFFGKENKEMDVSNAKGEENESSLDNFFTSSRSTKQNADSLAGSDPESEANVGKKTSSKEVVEEKPKKSLFSWGSSKRNSAVKNAPVPAPRKKKTTSDNKERSKSTNVWSSRPSETFGDDDDDDDDDVVMTPKISRKNPTKTASLLDELF